MSIVTGFFPLMAKLMLCSLGLKLFECSLDGCTKAFGEHASLIRHEKCVHGHFRKANPNRKKIHQKYSKAVDMTEMKHALVADASQSISPLVKAPEVHSIQSPPSSSYPYSSSTSALPVSYTWVASIPDQRFDTCLDDHVSLSPAPSCYNYELPQNNSFDGLFPLVRQSAPMANWIELPGIPICGAVLPQQNWLLTPSDVKQFWSTPGPDLSDWTYLRSPCTLGDLAS